MAFRSNDYGVNGYYCWPSIIPVDEDVMIHVFLLLVYLGTGDSRKLTSGDMYFRDINDCNYFASRVAKAYGNYQYSAYIDPKDRVTAYCVPKYINKDSVRIYE